jgi:hypothetical protein
MSRPICVIYFPEDYPLYKDGKIVEPMSLMKELNGWNADNDVHKNEVQERFGGYMYWCFSKPDIGAPEFQVFHPKDFTEADYKELEQLVMNKLKEITDVPANRE